MLVLSRRIDESVRIGSDIEIKILEIKGRQIRIGIKAPKDISVVREEAHMQIKVDPPHPDNL